MCGIAGWCLNPKHSKTVSNADLTGQMLLDIEHRGTDATGVAWINPKTGKRVIRKAPISASKFVPNAGSTLCAGATTAILHTRYATQGSPKEQGNNHPIPRGKIVLTHNGHISNDRELFKQLGVPRVAQVDSEAVAALIAFSKDKPWQALTEVYGTAALAWITANDPRNLHLARLNSSPLWIAQTNTGSLFYGSTKETVENACIMTDCDVDWIHEAQEGEYFQVRDGRIIKHETFTPAKSVSSFSLYGWDTAKEFETDMDWYGRYNQYKADKYSKWWDKHDEFLNF